MNDQQDLQNAEQLNQDNENAPEIEKMRHSFAHVLAQAVLRLHPTAKLGIGPAIENGFYYEFDIPEEIDEKSLIKIEKEMNKIIEEELPITQVRIPREEAFDMLHQQGQIFKTELLQEIPDSHISFYKTGDEFIDLCRGPHVKHTGRLKIFKLTNIDRVHWYNDESRPKLYKINGIAFETKKDLDKYLNWEEEKSKKEHKVLGPQRDYFNFRDSTIGPGLPIWMQEGTKTLALIKKEIREVREREGFAEVSTPAIAKVNLFKETGHFEFYQDFDINPFKVQGELYMLRPMATPSHIEVYRSKRHGTANMPVKYFEFAKLYREESSKELNGIARTREFTQEIGHIFVDRAKALQEIITLIDTTIEILRKFGFRDYRLQFSRRDKRRISDYLGNDDSWNTAEDILVKALEETKLVAREATGEADFYGPKIDFLIKDIEGKEWQLSTIQLDLVIPQRSNIVFKNTSGDDEMPYLIHHSIIGSLERFFALLVEFYSGAFPLWLAPTQVVVLPISREFKSYATQVKKELKEKGLRVNMDDRDETLQNRIREAQNDEIPYMIVVGKQEQTSNVVSVRPRNGEDMGIMKIEEFLDKIEKEIE